MSNRNDFCGGHPPLFGEGKETVLSTESNGEGPQTFEFDGVDVRVLGTPDAPLFVAADVAAILGITNPREALRGFPDTEKADVIIFDTRSKGGATQRRTLTAVTEPGLYRMIFRSTKPNAAKFQDWVFHEVLPTIRKTGAYSVQGRQLPTSFSEALRLLADSEESKEKAIAAQKRTQAALDLVTEAMIKVAVPTTKQMEEQASQPDDMSVRDAANLLPGNIGEDELYAWLRQNGWVNEDNTPTEWTLKMGYLRSHPDKAKNRDNQKRTTHGPAGNCQPRDSQGSAKAATTPKRKNPTKRLTASLEKHHVSDSRK